MTGKPILYIATVVSLVTYLFWKYLPKGSFYIGNSIFIFLLCVYLFLNEKGSIIKYILFAMSLNNLFDELTLDTDTLKISELLTGVSIFIFALIRKKKC